MAISSTRDNVDLRADINGVENTWLMPRMAASQYASTASQTLSTAFSAWAQLMAASAVTEDLIVEAVDLNHQLYYQNTSHLILGQLAYGAAGAEVIIAEWAQGFNTGQSVYSNTNQAMSSVQHCPHYFAIPPVVPSGNRLVYRQRHRFGPNGGTASGAGPTPTVNPIAIVSKLSRYYAI